MNPDLRDDEKATMRILSSAGWKPTERGALFISANLTYHNPVMRLEVDINPLRPSLFLTIEDPMGKSVDLVIHYENRLVEVLKKIVSFQDQITAGNFQQWIDELVKSSPAVYLDTGNEMIPLIHDDQNNHQSTEPKE